MAKTTPDVSNFLQVLKAVEEPDKALHVRRNFWYLIKCQVIVL